MDENNDELNTDDAPSFEQLDKEISLAEVENEVAQPPDDDHETPDVLPENEDQIEEEGRGSPETSGVITKTNDENEDEGRGSPKTSAVIPQKSDEGEDEGRGSPETSGVITKTNDEGEDGHANSSSPKKTDDVIPKKSEEQGNDEPEDGHSIAIIGHPLKCPPNQLETTKGDQEERTSQHGEIHNPDDDEVPVRQLNTPVSHVKSFEKFSETRNIPRPSVDTSARDMLFREAVDTLYTKYNTVVKMISTEPLFGINDPPPGYGTSRVFYIHQQKPKPMTPLKVWRGYRGNVYFEPVHIRPAPRREPTMEVHLPPLHQCSDTLQKVITRSRWNPEHTLQLRQQQLDYQDQSIHENRYRSDVRQSRRIRMAGPTTAAVLDRNAVFAHNPSPDEVQMIRSRESTGTLMMQTPPNDPGFWTTSCPQTPGSPCLTSPRSNKTKIYRGSVSRQLREYKQMLLPIMQREQTMMLQSVTPEHRRGRPKADSQQGSPVLQS